EVLDSFGTWREIRIADGNKGWIQQSAIALID
ncbi:MAG: competence protein, partial [Tidjanibacter sp.]|nr:competence protein [Tidjanibacter sp.]